MELLVSFFKNIYIWAAVMSWFTAQTLKLFLVFFKKKEWDFHLYASTGGMPSAHTATVIGLATAIGKWNGFESPLFAMAIIFATVVITDALHLRREVGRHAQKLQELTGKKFDVSSGHTPNEVLVGSLIGIFIGWLL
jgi:acid phosphatase family membrane protein YuiD